MNSYKLIFIGSSAFALDTLQALIKYGYDVVCVITQPDRKSGRNLEISANPVKLSAQNLGLNIFQPNDINSNESIKNIKSLNPDLFIVISYGQILSRQVLEIPKIFPINVHASLLPRYRGAAPINWALINGDKDTGITIMKMSEGMDSGNIIKQVSIRIDTQDYYMTLSDKLSKLGADTLISTLKEIKDNKFLLKEQDEKLVSYAPKLEKSDGLIDWSLSAKMIDNRIRGCFGWPGAFTYFGGKILKLYKAQVYPHGKIDGVDISNLICGDVIKISNNEILVKCGEGNLSIEKLQLEGGKILKASQFLAGHKIMIGDKLGKQ